MARSRVPRRTDLVGQGKKALPSRAWVFRQPNDDDLAVARRSTRMPRAKAPVNDPEGGGEWHCRGRSRLQDTENTSGPMGKRPGWTPEPLGDYPFVFNRMSWVGDL